MLSLCFHGRSWSAHHRMEKTLCCLLHLGLDAISPRASVDKSEGVHTPSTIHNISVWLPDICQAFNAIVTTASNDSRVLAGQWSA